MLQPPGQMNIFQKKDVHILKNMANQIIRIVENIETHIAGTLGCVFIDNETHESGVTKCTTGEAWSAFS